MRWGLFAEREIQVFVEGGGTNWLEVFVQAGITVLGVVLAAALAVWWDRRSAGSERRVVALQQTLVALTSAGSTIAKASGSLRGLALTSELVSAEMLVTDYIEAAGLLEAASDTLNSAALATLPYLSSSETLAIQAASARFPELLAALLEPSPNPASINEVAEPVRNLLHYLGDLTGAFADVIRGSKFLPPSTEQLLRGAGEA